MARRELAFTKMLSHSTKYFQLQTLMSCCICVPKLTKIIKGEERLKKKERKKRVRAP